MIVQFEFESYNFRRYSRPWGARVKLSGVRIKLDFCGAWNGTASEGGSVAIDARPGDIVACGQKDNRGGKTRTEYYKVGEDGDTEEVSKKEAFNYLIEKLGQLVQEKPLDKL